MNLVIAKTGFVAILCKSYVECQIAVSLVDLGQVEIGFGDGMHHSTIQTIFDHYPSGERRKLFATQNPFVLDCMGVNSANDVRERFLLVRNDKLVNMTEEQAQEFYGAYSRGVQYVNEILRTQGLW